jgi:hypothetical protein
MRSDLFGLITRRSQVQILSPQPHEKGKGFHSEALCFLWASESLKRRSSREPTIDKRPIGR